MSGWAVIFCGSRDWKSVETIAERVASYPEDTIIIHGACRGADLIAQACAVRLGYTIVPVPYFHWMGKRGGPERNRAMLEILLAYKSLDKRVAVEAFPLNGPGTQNMIDLAKDAGVPFRENKLHE